jgi:peptidoglycan/xylan/chitin deacetylase (PgdA/CDA1 family)/CelD/BcsL family acetyltransferase involved in cellulose biosynthesis
MALFDARIMASQTCGECSMIRITLHRNWDELCYLAADWDRLLAESSSDTIFLTWEWCEAWWKAYGNERSLFVLTAWEGSDLVGIAPFYVDRKRHWHKLWNCLRIIGDGSGDSDYLDCFTERGREHQVLAAFMQFLETLSDQWDWIQIQGAPQDSPCLAALIANATERGWSFASETVPCATLPLPNSWDSYLGTLRPRIRTKVRSTLGHLESQLKLTPTECAAANDLDIWLAQLFEVHTRRWEQRHQPGVFRSGSKRLFYRQVSLSTLEKGWLAFHRLTWGERPLALQYGFRYHNHLYVLQEGYDPSFEALRPGIALRGWVVRGEIERGLAEYDFLAGTARHKLDWGARPKLSRMVQLARKPAAAWASISFPWFTRSLRENAGRLLPESLQSWRQEFVISRRRRVWSVPNLPQMPLVKRWARWSASHLYSGTPLGAMSRQLADRYAGRLSGTHAGSLSLRSGSACTIFKYHRINDDHDPFLTALPVSRFCAQMYYLARHFQFVSLDQFASGLPLSEGDKGYVAITFDDGYRDNFVHAFPILKQIGIPATIFLTTSYIEANELPWYDQVRLAFKLTLRRRLSLRPMGGPDAILENEEQRLDALAHTLAWLRVTDEQERLQSLPQLFRELGVPSSLNLPATMLSWDQIRQMKKEGISFGAHTVTHPALGGLPVSRLQEEILGSKHTIENRLQSPVRHFAYPFGKQFDLGSLAKQVVQAAGFQTAVTTIPGVNGPGQDLLELRRVSLDERDLGMFGLKLDWSKMSATLAG